MHESRSNVAIVTGATLKQYLDVFTAIVHSETANTHSEPQPLTIGSMAINTDLGGVQARTFEVSVSIKTAQSLTAFGSNCVLNTLLQRHKHDRYRVLRTLIRQLTPISCTAAICSSLTSPTCGMYVDRISAMRASSPPLPSSRYSVTRHSRHTRRKSVAEDRCGWFNEP